MLFPYVHPVYMYGFTYIQIGSMAGSHEHANDLRVWCSEIAINVPWVCSGFEPKTEEVKDC